MTLINTKRFDIVLCSVLLPERFSVKTPCTLGIQFNGILQSRLRNRFCKEFRLFHRATLLESVTQTINYVNIFSTKNKTDSAKSEVSKVFIIS